MRLVAAVALVLASCGHAAAPAGAPPRPSRVAKLKPPAPADPAARGAAYLVQVALQLQPGWGQFLDDCRLRLPAEHPLNAETLAATAELAIDAAGRVVEIDLKTSGNGDFDRAVREAISDASPLPKPPVELWSDDDRVHLVWLFARDRRQAGPATARVRDVELPLADVIAPWLGRHELARAARRIARAPLGDDRASAAKAVALAAIEEGFASSDEALHQATFAPLFHSHAAQLAAWIARQPPAPAPVPPAPPPNAGGHLRRCVDAASASRAVAAAAIATGLRDRERAVRAACLDALTAQLRRAPVDPPLRAAAARIAELVHDRDIDVRARAVVAQLVLDARASAGVADEPAPEVRAAFAGELGEHFSEPRAVEAANALAADRAPEVRAAAWRSLAAHPEQIADPQAVARAAGDPAAEVRQLAARLLADDDRLAKLAASDESPAVRTEALVHLAERRGRAAMEPMLLEQIASSPPASGERVRAALAWLLAR